MSTARVRADRVGPLCAWPLEVQPTTAAPCDRSPSDGLDFAAFAPDPVRARALDCRARVALAASLHRLFEACAGDLSWERADQTALLESLPRHPVRPALFAVYADLVEAVFADDLPRARGLLDTLLAPALRQPASPHVATLHARDLGEGIADIYRRFIDDDPALQLTLRAADAGETARVENLVAQLGLLLDTAAPALAGEIAAIAHEIICVDGGPPGASGFDGASTFYLWGAVALNTARLGGRVDLAEALAHEAGHAYLLGATLGAPLVANDPAERFASPLRADPRPMDGLVHASFVLARMVWCQDALLAGGALDAAETATVLRSRATNVGRYAAGENLIAARARFTETGATLWRSARAWMAARHLS